MVGYRHASGKRCERKGDADHVSDHEGNDLEVHVSNADLPGSRKDRGVCIFLSAPINSPVYSGENSHFARECEKAPPGFFCGPGAGRESRDRTRPENGRKITKRTKTNENERKKERDEK